MGVVANMLSFESLRIVASLNNRISEGLQMENGNCMFVTQHMYKKRKVSAVRDFPPGCGCFAPRIDSVPSVDAHSMDPANLSDVVDKSGEELQDKSARTFEAEARESEFTKTLGKTNDSSFKKENPVVLSNHVDGPTLNKDEPGKVLLTESQALEDNGLTNTAEAVNVDGPTLNNNEPEKVLLMGSKVLEDNGLTNTAEAVIHVLSDMSKDLHKLGSSLESKMVLSTGPKVLSQDANIVCPSGCLEKIVTRRYPPRRRVSAIRDFPPLCGRNAPCLGKDECLKGISFVENRSIDQHNFSVNDKMLKMMVEADVKGVENNVHAGDACRDKAVDLVGADLEGNATDEEKQDDFGPSPETKKHKCITLPDDYNHHQVERNSKAAVKEDNHDFVQCEGLSGKEIVVYQGVQSPCRKRSEAYDCQNDVKRNFGARDIASDRVVVLGLMSESECPWRSGKSFSKTKHVLIEGAKKGKGKKVDFFARLEKSKAAVKTKNFLNHSGQKSLKKKKGSAISEENGQLVIWEKNHSQNSDENIEAFQMVPVSNEFNVNVPPIGSGNSQDNESNVTRNKVREIRRLFQAVCRKLLQEEEAKSKDGTPRKRVDLQAAKILKKKDKYINTGKQILGAVPGVEVGDEFQYRVELIIIGLHRQIQGGIDYVKHNGKILATSIVSSGGYADDLGNSDVMIYTGQGGNVLHTDKAPEDQKLERGNLALKNSSEVKNVVRVIRGSEGNQGTDGKGRTYVYDGLYVVEKYWQDMGPHGKLVFKFQLHRMPGQPELAWKEVKKSKKFKTREGLCVEDVSGGKERIPICAVNTKDDEKPPPFTYSTTMIYPNWCNPIPPEGCNCTNECSDSEKCSCAVKNGGEIPFNYNGAIVEAKPLVYECGPSCKCPPTCHNRVSQHGIRLHLEIFKTKTRGWGVRSLNSIPSGSFICEYIGELLEETEAEQRTGNDEYLFDIGNNNSSSNLWNGLSTLMPDAQASSSEFVGDSGFTIDAFQYGNVGRFINHSCSPNLYAQNVLYDHDDRRIPHIMLFAAENIPPLQELTYDYNYMIGQVHDSDGNVKRKDCYCGSEECTGRMY